jgi:hypothetical protein
LSATVLSAEERNVSDQFWLGVALDVDAAHAIRLKQVAKVRNGSMAA